MPVGRLLVVAILIWCQAEPEPFCTAHLWLGWDYIILHTGSVRVPAAICAELVAHDRVDIKKLLISIIFERANFIGTLAQIPQIHYKSI